MKIAFTGHRNQIANEALIIALVAEYPDAEWVHGGAQGFDTQIARIAECHNVPAVTIKPNYDLHGKRAPLIRNHEIVNGADMLVACYDGRKTGGTLYTINLAKRLEIPIRVLAPA